MVRSGDDGNDSEDAADAEDEEEEEEVESPTKGPRRRPRTYQQYVEEYGWEVLDQPAHPASKNNFTASGINSIIKSPHISNL